MSIVGRTKTPDIRWYQKGVTNPRRVVYRGRSNATGAVNWPGWHFCDADGTPLNRFRWQAVYASSKRNDERIHRLLSSALEAQNEALGALYDRQIAAIGATATRRGKLWDRIALVREAEQADGGSK